MSLSDFHATVPAAGQSGGSGGGSGGGGSSSAQQSSGGGGGGGGMSWADEMNLLDTGGNTSTQFVGRLVYLA